MKISAISSNNTFKGLFTDKTKNENWLMEYRPYSWELYHNTSVHAPYYDVKKPVMEKKQQINILASRLPDNEEIFSPMDKRNPAISKDILGTVSYYEYPLEVNLGEYRNHITESAPMNLEESLKVYLKKNEIFKEMKQAEINKTKQAVQDSLKKLREDIDKCDSAAHDSDGFHLFNDVSTKRCKAFYNLRYQTMRNHEDIIEKYMKLTDSMGELKDLITKMKSELRLISEKQKTGDIIDISIRHENDPNKALYEEGNRLVQNPSEMKNTQKIVLLSHRTVPLKELVQQWIKQNAVEYKENLQKALKRMPEGLTNIADHMITFRL